MKYPFVFQTYRSLRRASFATFATFDLASGGRTGAQSHTVFRTFTFSGQLTLALKTTHWLLGETTGNGSKDENGSQEVGWAEEDETNRRCHDEKNFGALVLSFASQALRKIVSRSNRVSRKFDSGDRSDESGKFILNPRKMVALVFVGIDHA